MGTSDAHGRGRENSGNYEKSVGLPTAEFFEPRNPKSRNMYVCMYIYIHKYDAYIYIYTYTLMHV